MSRISTAWRSVSKNTRGAPPVYAELWNTGFVSERVMKVSAARTPARRSGGGGGSGIKDGLVHGLASSVGVAGARPSASIAAKVGAATGRRQRVRFRAT